MEGKVVIEGARNCVSDLGSAGQHEEAWRRVSQDPSWMHSCNHMWGLISEKLTELKETRDHNAGKIVVRGAAAKVPAERGAGFDGYFPAPAVNVGMGYFPAPAVNVGMGVGAMARGVCFGAPVPPVAPPLAPLPGPPPLSQNSQPSGRMEDRRTDDSRRTGRDKVIIQSQPRRSVDLTDVAGAILKAKKAYMNTRAPAPVPAPPQANLKDRLHEPRNDAVRKDVQRDGANKGREVEVRRASGAGPGGRWNPKGVVVQEEKKELQLARQGMHMVKHKEGNMAQAPAIAEVAMHWGEKRKRDAETERKQGRGKRSRHSHGDSEVATAPKDTSENDKLRVVLFRTEGGRAVHVVEKSEFKSDPVSVVEAARDQEATESSADEGAETVSPLRLEKKPRPAVMDEASSEPRSRVVMCNRKDMPTSSAGDPLPVKRKRRMDEVMEDGKPAKRPGTGRTFIRQAHQQPPDPEEPEVEFKCGCTSKELGDRVGHLKAYKSGELVIFCECEPGCPEAGKPLSPSAFESHAGRGAARKWKHTVWLVVGNEKVPLHKVEAMQPYLAKNKGRRHLVRT